MATNFPGPYQVRIFYDVTPSGHVEMEHVLQLNVTINPEPTPGDAFSTINAVRRDTGVVTLDTAVDSLIVLLRPLWSAGEGTFNRAELWKFTPGTFLATYVSSYDISLSHTGIVTSIPGGQEILTFRSLEGGIMKLVLQETEGTPAISEVYADMDVPYQDLVDEFTTTATGVWLARDTSYPFLFMKRHPGESEYLFKKRFRS